MSAAGMDVHLDTAGNLIGHYEGTNASLPVHIIGSHLDTVPDAGKYDGVLGVLVGIAAVQAMEGTSLPFGIDVIAFSEEEGVRYRGSVPGQPGGCRPVRPTVARSMRPAGSADAQGVSLVWA